MHLSYNHQIIIKMEYTKQQISMLNFYSENTKLVKQLMSSGFASINPQMIVDANNRAQMQKKEYCNKFGNFPSDEEIKKILP